MADDVPKCRICGTEEILSGGGYGPKDLVYTCPNECEIEKAIKDWEEVVEADQEIHAEYINSDPAHLPQYENHCWNCGASIDSRTCKEDPRNGYFCNNCGKSLREWKKRNMKIQSILA